MSTHIQKKIVSGGKSLLLTVVSFNDGEINPGIALIVEDAFSRLAPFLKDTNQTLYIRDIDFLAIDGQFPGGHCYNRHEAMIAVPSWPTDEQQLKATINHELHHLARWQNAGYGFTLGGALLSEGLATYYEKQISGWIPPWSVVKVSNKALHTAVHEYESEDYDHGEWFFNGERGKWVGYGIGYAIAEDLFASGFDLERSLKVSSDDAKSNLYRISTQ